MPLSTFSVEFVLARSSGVITSHNGAEIGDGVDAAGLRIEPHDRARREDVAVELAVDAFELVDAGDLLLAAP